MGITQAEWNNLSGTDRRSHEATIKATVYLTRVKSRIKAFNERAIPFILRQTMNHPLQAGIYSTTSGKGEVIRTDEDGNPFIVSGEKIYRNTLLVPRLRDFQHILKMSNLDTYGLFLAQQVRTSR